MGATDTGLLGTRSDGCLIVDLYNRSRPHQALENNSPFPRAVQPPSRGWIRAVPEVGGLYHRYQRVA
jgi:putative transposase